MNKEKLFQELKELNLLWSGLSRIPNFPKELLELSLSKLEKINSLMEELKDISPHSQTEAVTQKKDNSEVGEFSKKKEAASAEPAFEKETPAEEPTLSSAAVDLNRIPSAAPETEPASVSATSLSTTATEPASASATSLSAPATESAEQLVSPSANRIPKPKTTKSECLVDRFEKNSSKASMQKKLENRHFADLSKALSLNDRFRFRRDLFGNSPQIMDQVLQDINALQSMDEALAYLHKNYSQYSETESFTDFCTLLDNHFTS